MPLSEQDRADLTAAAEAEGFDAERVKAIVAAADEPEDESPAERGNAPVEPPKLYQYQLPALRLSEFRAYLKMIGIPLGDEPMPNENLPYGQWLAKYGGALSGAPAASDAGASPEAPPAE